MDTPQTPEVPPSIAASKERPPEVASALVLATIAFLILMSLSIAATLVFTTYGGVEAVRSGIIPEAGWLEKRTQALLAHPWAIAGLVGLQSSLFAVCALLVARWAGPTTLAALRLGRTGTSFITDVAAVVGIVAFSEFSGIAIRVFGWDSDGSLARLREAFVSATPGQLAAMVVSIGLIAAIAEELVFRGYIQGRLIRRWGRWPGIVGTSLLFGAIHLDPVHSAFAALLGLLLGWYAEASGGIRIAIVAHVVNNVVAVLTVKWLTPEQVKAPEYALGVALVAIACFFAVRTGLERRPAPEEQAAAVEPVEG